MSLLRDIQNDLASASGDVTTVLRKCKILAARLGSDEFAQWVERELNGYPDSQPIPDYRRLTIQHYASFMNVAYTIPQTPVPLEFVPQKYREAFTRIKFGEGIAKACTFMRGKNGAIIQKPDLIFALQGKMYPDMNCQGVWGVVPANEFEQLVSAVKNRVLDLVLKIEAENPEAGEAPLHSQPVPVEKLQPPDSHRSA
jgi:AbiTii